MDPELAHRPGPSQKSGRIYVYYPRGTRTGGPEALHQLVHTLRGLGHEAFLVPMRRTVGIPRVDDFSVYDAPEAERVQDALGNTVVVPELYLEGLEGVRMAKRFCWWLSIDNSPLFRAERRLLLGLDDHAPMARLRRLRNRYRATTGPARIRWSKLRTMEHLTQSHYAWSFLYTRLNIVGSALSDYTRTDVACSNRQSGHPSRPVVAYNVAKGGHLVDQLRQRSNMPVTWKPITGMTPGQVVETLKRADIYLDLGHQPGKDRMPREAASAGALVVVARQGAGAFSSDVPIPWEHKVDTRGDIVDNATATLESLLPRLADEGRRQAFYRSVIAGEQSTFEAEVRAIFSEGKTGTDVVIDALTNARE